MLTRNDVKQRSDKLVSLLQYLVQLYNTNKVAHTNISPRALIFILAACITSSSVYGSFLLIKKVLGQINEKREYQKLKYYYLLNDKDRNVSSMNPYAIKKNKSLLRSISLVGFNRVDIALSNQALNVKTIYIKQRDRIKKILIKRIDNDFFDRNNLIFKNFKKKVAYSSNSLFNFHFLNKLLIIWNILIPNVFNRNSYLLVCQIVFLILRTYLSVLITRLDGQIIKDIVNRNFKSFCIDLGYWFAIAFPSSYVNSGIKFLEKRLALNFRTNLIRYIHDLYLNDRMVFYKVNAFGVSETDTSNKVAIPESASSDAKLSLLKHQLNSELSTKFEDKESPKLMENIDQFITSDITKFSDFITSLISSLGKPIIDVIIFSIYLRDNLGTAGITGLFASYGVTALFLKRHTPDFGELTKKLQGLEGEYINYHTNLIRNSEEISFYNGLKVEKTKVNSIFDRLINHISFINDRKISYNFLEEYILKTIWNSSGYIFAALPILLSHDKKIKASTSLRQFITNKRLIFSLSDAGSRLIYSVKDISTLSGYTDRVFNLLALLHRSNASDFSYNDQFINDVKGTIQDDYNGMRMEKVSIVVPSKLGSYNTKLINKLSFLIKEGENLLILGFNGSGKTSIERVIAGLWPLYRGLLSKPNDKDIVYLPQVPYFLSNGTLRDQIIYPLSEIEFYENGNIEDDLVEVLKLVKLDYLLSREENYLSSVHDWNSVLSGGEKQRISFARVLIKKPKFVILDESTNAISTDIEDYLYELLKFKKITFITLSHRPLLIKYHDYLIQIINKEGEWKFETLGSNFEIKSIENEIETINSALNDETKLIERKKTIDQLLNDDDDDSDGEDVESSFYSMYE